MLMTVVYWAETNTVNKEKAICLDYGCPNRCGNIRKLYIYIYIYLFIYSFK